MSAHTPGPWLVTQDVYGKFDVSIFAGEVRYGKHVAMVNVRASKDEHEKPPREESLANAHLIAAAPLMLAALKVVEVNCPCGARPESPNTHPHVSGCPVGYALAKASGR